MIDLALQQHLHSLSLPECLDAWKIITKNNKDRKAMRTLACSDLFYLLVVICHRHDALHPWVYARAREVEQRPDGYLDLWAREHYKSTLITFAKTLQDILINPSMTIGIISEKCAIASNLLIQIRTEFEDNRLLKTLFPDILYENPVMESKRWTNTEIIVKRKSNRKEATITAQGLESIKTGDHYDLMVFDDVITQKSVNTPDQVHKITNQFQLSLSMSRQGGKKRYIGTRYSHADTYQHILDEKMAIPRIYPATDDGTPAGNPVLFTDEYWEQKVSENSAYNLACQYIQNPLSGTEKTFNIEHLNFWDVRPFNLSVYILGDPGIKKTTQACDTALVVIGVTPNKHLFLLDGYCHKMSMSDRWFYLSMLHERWSKTPGITNIHVAYETYGAGASDVEYFKEQMSKGIERSSFQINELQRTIVGNNSKNARIERMEPDLKKKYIFLPWDNQGTPTPRQREKQISGESFLCSRPIKVKVGPQETYDLGKIFIDQLDKYPFGRKVDLIDAFSRIYDCEIRAPTSLDQKYGRTYSLPRQPFGGVKKQASVSRNSLHPSGSLSWKKSKGLFRG